MISAARKTKHMGQAARYPCSHCGTLNDASDQFCSNCGYLLSGGPTGTVPAISNAPTIATASPPVASTAAARRITGAFAAGQLLGGRYRNLGRVGQGGFGAVYKASDERFKSRRTVAIKEMSDANLSPAEKARALDDFRQEADLLVQLKHPNLPDVSDFLEEGGKAYLVMEFVEGITLEKAQEDAGKPLDEKLVMPWALQLCDVLGYLHSRPQPIIFRDLKPSNVMVTNTGQVKLIDFGIARIFKSSAAKDTTTLGSRGYAPLEQYGHSQSDPRSDIYALGATLYDLLTNAVPADAPTRRINPTTFMKPRQVNPTLSKDTERIILKAMAEDPKDRYQSAGTMFSAIVSAGFAPGKQGSYATVPAPLTPLPTAPGLVPTIPAPIPAANPPAPSTVAATTPSPAPLILPGGANALSPAHATVAQTTLGAPPPALSQQPIQIAGQAPASQPAILSANPTLPPTYPPANPATLASPPAQGASASGGGPGGGSGGISRRSFVVGGLVAAGIIAGGGFAASRILGGNAQEAGQTVRVDFTFSTEKSDWLNATLTAFNNSSQINLAGSNKIIQVVLNDSGSLDVKDKIVSGELKPVAWSPANQVELNRLSYAWARANNGRNILYSSTDLSPQSLVSSPLVMAVWKDRAEAFIQTYRKIDWDTLHTALLNNNGWGAANHPEWGAITLGQTRPDLSNSGLLSVMLMAYAYAQKNKQVELTLDLVQNADLWNNYIQVFEKVVNHFGDSSGTYFQQTIIPERPSGHSISFTYENLVLLNQQQALQSGGEALQIYYPTQETVSEHPFAILNAPWVTAEQIAAAKQFRAFLLSHTQQKLALQFGFRPSDLSISLTDNSIASNPFKQLAQLSPAQNFNPQTYTTVPLPQGNVIDELIKQWGVYNPNPS